MRVEEIIRKEFILVKLKIQFRKMKKKITIDIHINNK